MFKTRPCGCKGLRSCKICEELYGAYNIQKEFPKENSFVFCPSCMKIFKGWETESYKEHPSPTESLNNFPGVLIIPDFINKNEEKQLLKDLDDIPWNPSQSGRQKQNYGPKCNFKKRKVQLGSFSGYPECTKFIQDRFNEVELLSTFHTVEQCSLDYTTDKGSSIDPHIDDCWIWGERIPTLSLLSDSVLTLSKFEGPLTKYNLPDTLKYPQTVDNQGKVKDPKLIEEELKTMTERKPSACSVDCPAVVRIPMPRRSLLVLYGPARYDYEHCILREDVDERRVCITYRELTPPFLTGGPFAEVGSKILDIGTTFWPHTQTEDEHI